MLIQIVKIITNIAFAIGFGVIFWWFLEFIQPDVINYKFSCCERCGNILFDREQPILAACAGLAFLVSAFLKIKGWKILLITIGVSFLCFYPYWLFTFWTGHPRQECTALNYPRGSFPFINEIVMFIISGFWSSVCSIIFIIYFTFRKLFWNKEEEIV